MRRAAALVIPVAILVGFALPAAGLHGTDPNCPAGANHYVVAGDTNLGDGKDCIGEPNAGGPYHNTWNLGSGQDSALSESGVDRVNGQGGPDFIDGGGSNDVLTGGDGNDTLREGDFGGDDELWGGPGDDKIVGGDGADGLHGEGGQDRLIHFHCGFFDLDEIGGFEIHDHRDCP